MEWDWDGIVGTAAVVVPWIVTGANIITSMTPTKTDDAIWNGISRVLNIFALNVGRNRNADDV